ncbi:hypothetical protein EZJ43_14775 [Pedobacter changchengzhani]|uniref:Uncharacterized protein n=1 Tax=Pedobacter changchengzhani TaxID=2529274 RepID=A0A4R5MHZ4_9SPHI|nr:hypothetical protein [Pedobacter changchengzhani]TDG35162.1 hypothetical protein EZJ43_14775 [Pedobacter changchengzhani]
MDAPNRVNAVYDRGNKKIEITLDLLYWIDDDIHFYYSAALDLTGYGESEDEARSSFQTTLNAFVDYTDNNKTVFAELERLGWTTNKTKKRINPPSEEDMLLDNDTYKQLLERPDIVHSETNFGFALI